MAEDRPYEIRSAIEEADSMGEKWRQALDQALDLRLSSAKPTRPGDSAEFVGKALGSAVRLRISGTALQQLYGDDSLTTAARHRDDIEHLFRARFRQQPSSDLLLTSHDLSPKPQTGKLSG
jgi:hypothetical protein